MASKEKRNAKSEATHQAAMEIIAGEKRKHDQKTARLRAAREAAGPPGRPSKRIEERSNTPAGLVPLALPVSGTTSKPERSHEDTRSIYTTNKEKNNGLEPG
jgi:hypothetical protein